MGGVYGLASRRLGHYIAGGLRYNEIEESRSLRVFYHAMLQGIRNRPGRRQTLVGDAHLLDCNGTEELFATRSAATGGAFLVFGHGQSVAGA